jgi:hypothetical protein
LTAVSALLLVLAVALLVLNRDLGFRALSPHLVLVPGFAVAGLVLAVRRPGHAIGWLFVGMGLAAAVHSAALQSAIRALATAPGSLPAGSWLAWLAYWTWSLNLPALGPAVAAVPRRPPAVPALADGALATGGGRRRRDRLVDAAAGPDRPERGHDRQPRRGCRP